MRDPKEPGDNYNMKEHIYHDSNVVQGLPGEQLKTKGSKQKVSNKSQNSKKKKSEQSSEKTVVKVNPYDEPFAHEMAKPETSSGKQKSKDTSAARSGGNSRGSVGRDVTTKSDSEENTAPKRRELISAPAGIDVETLPVAFVENETGESSGIKLISKKVIDGTTTTTTTTPTPTRKPTFSALTRHQTWKEEDSFGTTKKAVVVTKVKPRVQPESREVKHFRRNAFIITLFLGTILVIVAIVVVCLIAFQ
ncbi:uncharacterized protein [Antedon mediterranea]|uniref:uncharacterized protein n=1 Tax=Antedon mediterranea TaxID=105859 RepID=UPI003AF9F6AB